MTTSWYAAAEQVSQAVIQNLIVAGGTARFDLAAPHATTFTYLHRKPGEHRFKAFGANAQGIGPQSAEAVASIA